MDRPSFKYNIYGNSVTDITKVLDNRQGIQRTIVLKNTGEKLYVRIATASDMEEISAGFYLIDDHSYYIKLDDTGNASAIIREQNGKKELLIPIQNKITYSILF
jgi:predicted aminopeptidase